MLAYYFKILTEFGQQSVDWLREKHLEAGQKASGNTYDSFKFEVKQDDEAFTLNITGADTVQWLESGRGRGGIPRNWTEIMTKWISDKGISGQFKSEQEKKSFIYLVGRKISQEGNLQYRTGKTFSGQSNPISSAFHEQELEKLKVRLLSALTKTIKSDIIVEYKKANA